MGCLVRVKEAVVEGTDVLVHVLEALIGIFRIAGSVELFSSGGG